MIECIICNEDYDEPLPDIALRTGWNICNDCLQVGIDNLEELRK